MTVVVIERPARALGFGRHRFTPTPLLSTRAEQTRVVNIPHDAPGSRETSLGPPRSQRPRGVLAAKLQHADTHTHVFFSCISLSEFLGFLDKIFIPHKK